MARQPLFLITNAPGPYRLLQGYMAMFDKDRKFIVELTIKPIGEGEKLIGHDREVSATFQAALISPAWESGSSKFDKANFRLLGRFLSYPGDPYIKEPHTDDFDKKWCWEAVFSFERKGFIYKLKDNLPWEWTL